jgi:(p)ppGpp synthase/HD superfamily hydrolase
MNVTENIDKAIRISAIAHQKQSRKGSNTPYIVHPFAVMCIASQYTDDESTLIACLLHDVIEDVSEEYSQRDMVNDFGQHVIDIVIGVTKQPNMGDWHATCEAYLTNLETNAPIESAVVSVADKIHNIMSILEDYQTQGEKIWDIFSEDKHSQLWWFKSTREVAGKMIPENKILGLFDEYITKIENIINQ